MLKMLRTWLNGWKSVPVKWHMCVQMMNLLYNVLNKIFEYFLSKKEKNMGEESSLAIAQAVQDAPIISSYNDRIRPLLDTVDSLRHLMITREGIQLPTIVVVGDQSSGKSSVLESLASINLPHG